MILSDVSQRRMLVDSIEEVRRIFNTLKGREKPNFYELGENLYLITITDMRVGDYYYAGVDGELKDFLHLGVAGLDKEDIKSKML